MKKNTFYITLLVIYVLAQAVYVIFFPLPFISDSAKYVLFAQSALQENTYYPNPSSIYSEWLVAPVYMNYLIVLLKINNSSSIILLFNILLNTLQLILVCKVTEKMFGTRAAILAGLLYMVYLNNMGLVLLNLTELPFGILILASIYFYLSPPTITNGLLCGIMAGLAIGVRPTAYALILAFLLVYVVDVLQHKARHAKPACILAGILLYIIPMGLLAKRNIGQFEFTSTTGPANLIMSANPRAKGVFDAYFFYNDSTYLTKKTYIERNEYLLKRSKAYLTAHPWKWISLIPRKLYSTFISDGWAIPQLLNTQKWDLNVYLKGKADVKQAFRRETLFFRLAFWTLNIWQQLIYGLIAVFFLYQLYSFVRGKRFTTGGLLINAFIVCGVGLSILSSVGNPRYKYNFVIVGIVLVSPWIVDLLDKFFTGKNQKHGETSIS